MGKRDEYVQTIKSTAVSLQTKIIMGLVVAEFPWMANPFLNKLLRYFVEKFISKSVDAEEMLIFFKYIDFRTVAQGNEFYAAAHRNRLAQINGTPEEKASAEKYLMVKLRALAVVTN